MIRSHLAALFSLVLLAACSGNTPPPVGANTDDAGTTGLGNQSGIGSSALGGSAEPGTQGDLEQNVGDRVLFGFNSFSLDGASRATLDQQADWMRRYPNLIVTIEGHADERGTTEYNLALGDRRANAVKNYLVSLGIGSNRIGTISFGKERPANPGHNAAAWAENRRAVTQVRLTN